MSVGTLVGGLFGTPKTGAIDGFVFAVLAIFSWPWIMPRMVDEWIDDNYA